MYCYYISKVSLFVIAKASPRLRPVSTVSDVIHDLHPMDHGNRTPSRAGERKLPDIPYENYENPNDNGGSELYATLGSALAEGGSDSEEAETEPTESNHPYAKGEKSNCRQIQSKCVVIFY